MEHIDILIVDDTSSMRAFVKAAIRASFSGAISIDEAGSGEMAKEKLEAKPYDVIICDWHMPGLSGTDLLAWVREQDKLRDTMFIMLTAHNEMDVITKAMEAGVNDFIAKPVTVDTISKKLTAAFRTVLSVKIKKAGGSRPGGG